MINLRDKSFKNNLTGEIVRVLDSFEDIAILQDRSKVDSRHLLNPGLFTEISNQPIQPFNESLSYNTDIVEEVAPENFFSNQGAYNSLADKIKNIPAHMIKDDPNAGQAFVRIEDPEGNPTTTSFDRGLSNNNSNNESVIIKTTLEDEKAELARKYGVVNSSDAVSKQNSTFAKLLGEEEEVTVVNVNREDDVVNVNREEEVKVVESKQDYVQPQPVFEDPILKMFKGVKRSLDFNVSIQIDNKIPRVDFIEMMEDSYETSIIDFLADEFTNNIINNPEMIKDMIKSKINEVVYGLPEVNSQITDSVTQKPVPPPSQVIREGEDPIKVKQRTPRTSRIKKEEVK
jgi:hypothetical protein